MQGFYLCNYEQNYCIMLPRNTKIYADRWVIINLRGKKMVFKRNIRLRIEHALKAHSIVVLAGARKTGKTTLAKQLAEQKMYNYVNFADIRQVIAAQDDPVNFINKCEHPVVFDEIQRIPELFLAIKQDVERNPMTGRYVFTASADLQQSEAFNDLLAQIAQLVPIYPLSQGELSHSFDAFIDTVFGQELLVNLPCMPIARDQLFERMLIGGFPSVQEVQHEQRDGWINNYITSIIHSEITRMMHIEGVTTIPQLLFTLAKHVSLQMNGALKSRQTAIAVTTLNRYVELLKSLYIIYMQSSPSDEIISRVAKTPKLFMVDTGLLGWLLNLNTSNMHMHQELVGQQLHNFVFNELQKQMSWNTTPVKLYHMRTINGVMVDFVLERSDGTLVGIVVKNSTNITAKDIKGLVHLKEHAHATFHRGIVLYPGDESIPMGRHISTLPISALWSFSKDIK